MGAQRDPNWNEIRPDEPPEGPKSNPGGSKMEAKGPRWEPRRGQKPPQEPLRCHSAAWSSPSRRQDASQGAKGRLVHVFVSHFGTQTVPQGGPNRIKMRTKSETENMFVLDHVSGPIFIDLGVQKKSLLGPAKGSKCMQRL